MMTRRALLLASGLLFLTLGNIASAKGQLQVHGTLIELGVNAAAGRFTLANTGDMPVAAQVRVFSWSQQGGQDRLAPTSDIVLSPPIVRIPAGGEQVIRLIRQGPATSGRDQTYRVIVDELPDKSQPNASGVTIRMRYVVPMYVRDALAKLPALACRINRQEQKATLTCINSGGRAAQLGASSVHGAGGEKYELTPGLFGYVLPASTRQWPLDAKRLAKLGSSLTLESRLNGQPFTLPIVSTP